MGRPLPSCATTAPASPGASAARSPSPCSSCRATETGCVVPASTRGSADYVTARYAEHLVDGAGHFLPEEAPDAVSSDLADSLDRLG